MHTISMSKVTAAVAILGALLVGEVCGSPVTANPFEQLKRRAEPATAPAPGELVVDLGYEIYQGVPAASAKLNTWKGIRFAAPPTGQLRWQAPQAPAMNRSNVIPANAFGPQCPQSSSAPSNISNVQYGDEDCLSLNVWAPQNASNLPVLVWIHGGGYGVGNGRQDMSSVIGNNSYGFIGVSIQYRLGAFGFLASSEVFENGVVNAALLDQHFALKWVQSYIHLFGGDPTRVTITGNSAGGGSVMLQAMAYGGSLGNSLFTNAHASSPYLPLQYGYSHWIPSQSYYVFAMEAGCSPATRYGNSSQTVFKCLVGKDSRTLQAASHRVSSAGSFGTWGFLPVTDGIFVQELPTQQLLKKRVNGQRMLAGNTAQEGAPFTPKINTQDELIAWLKLTFPRLTDGDVHKILLFYPSTDAPVNPNDPRFATLGYTGATALNVSETATGQQQRAYNIYSETTFVCPSYWLAEAFSDNGREAWKYQHSAVPANHGTDSQAFSGSFNKFQGPDYATAFMKSVGNFVMMNNPSISSEVAVGAANTNSTSAGTKHPASSWPMYTVSSPLQLNFNQTGGTPSVTTVNGMNMTFRVEPGLKNDLTVVNAYTWEGGRGFRCDFWKSIAQLVPQ